MKSAIKMIVATAIVLTSSLVTATALPKGFSVHEGLPAGYGVTDLRIVGEVGGFNINMTGTVLDILAQMEIDHPGFKAEFILSAPANTTGLDTRALEARQHRFGFQSRLCLCRGPAKVGWDDVEVSLAWVIINYLRSIHAECWVPNRYCTNVGCYQGAVVTICNDNYNEEFRASCDLVADWASDIVSNCFEAGASQIFRGQTLVTVCGQQFSQWGWNAIVRAGRC